MSESVTEAPAVYSPVESPPPSPRVPLPGVPDPRLRLAQLVHALSHQRDARLLGEFLRLRAGAR